MYHGMHPGLPQQQQSQTLNRSGIGASTYGYGPTQPNYHGQGYGTLPPPQQQQQQQQSIYNSRPESAMINYHPPHQQHHPYYERAYSVQGDIMMDDYRRHQQSGLGRPMGQQHLLSQQQQHPVHQQHPQRRDLMSSKSVDYSTMDVSGNSNGFGAGAGLDEQAQRAARRHRSRSTDNMNELILASSKSADLSGFNSDTLKRMLQPVQPSQSGAGMSPNASPLTSPEVSRRSVNNHLLSGDHRSLISNDGFQSEPETGR